MTVYKCIYDTKDIHIGERRLLSIMSQNYYNFSQVANKNLHFALQKFYKAKCRKGFVKKITCYSSRRCITDHTAKAPRQPHLLQKEQNHRQWGLRH